MAVFERVRPVATGRSVNAVALAAAQVADELRLAGGTDGQTIGLVSSLSAAEHPRAFVCRAGDCRYRAA